MTRNLQIGWEHLVWKKVDTSDKYPIKTVLWSMSRRRLKEDFDWRNLILTRSREMGGNGRHIANDIIRRYQEVFKPGMVYSIKPELLDKLVGGGTSPFSHLVGKDNRTNIAEDCQTFLVADEPILVVEIEKINFAAVPSRHQLKLAWIEFHIPIITLSGRNETIRVKCLDITDRPISHWLSVFVNLWTKKEIYDLTAK